MDDGNRRFSFARWLPGFTWRFILWNAANVSIVRGYSWLFGYDDEFKAWVVGHRADMMILVVLSWLAYGMMDWMRSNEP